MPIRHTDKGWYWGSKGPFGSRAKAVQVAQAAYSSGYKPEHAADGEIIVVGDGGADPGAEEYLFVPKGSAAVVAPKIDPNEEPNMGNATKAIFSQFLKEGAKAKLSGAEGGAMFGLQGTDIRDELVPQHQDAGWFVNQGGTLQMSRPVDPIVGPSFGGGGRQRTPTPAPVAPPIAAPKPAPRAINPPRALPAAAPQELDTGVGLGTNTTIPGAPGVMQSPGLTVAGPPAPTPSAPAALTALQQSLMNKGEGVAIGGGGPARIGSLASGSMAERFANRGRSPLNRLNSGGIVGGMHNLMNAAKQKLRHAQYGALAGGSNDLLSMLAGLSGLGNQTSSQSLDWMREMGNINPAAFGQTDPSIIRGMIGGGPTLGARSLDEQIRQGTMQNQLGQSRLGLDRTLGMGGLDVQRMGINTQARTAANSLAEQTAARKADQAMNARQMLMTRAGRQLNAPGGNVIPSMTPILGRSTI